MSERITQELHLGPKDFTLQWYSGTGKGGQHRNKHQNCCRITHNETGLTAVGTSSRERSANQREAFTTLAKRILAWYAIKPERRSAAERVRNYHAVRNEVLDHASGMRMPYSQVVGNCDIGPMIEARIKAKGSTEE